jgi:dienelactone hydrolase
VTSGGWFDGTVACWLDSSPEARFSVLILPPLGYEASSAARTVTALSRAIAASGGLAVTADYPGTGDSAGEASLDSWRTAIADLRGALQGPVAVIGIGGGALLAPAADAVVTIAAPKSGRGLVRALRLLGQPDPEGTGVSVGGYFLAYALLEDLSTLVLGAADLVIDAGPATRQFLESPAEEAVVPTQLVDEVVTWIARSVAPGDRVELTLPKTAAGIRETFVMMAGLPGVLTTGHDNDKVLVLLNSGSDPHTGPGRAWVELARATAASEDWSVLRWDARGWGRAPSAPHGEARPYDPHMRDDITAVVRDLRVRGYHRIVVAGLCAGAWMALDAARAGDVDGVIALNPQLYWDFGDPVEALIATTVARRAVETAAIHAGDEQGRWDREDAAGSRPRAAAWLDELHARGVPVELVFAQDDPGGDYLRHRFARRLAAVTEGGTVHVTDVPEIDHGMQRAWLRQDVFRAFAQALRRM